MLEARVADLRHQWRLGHWDTSRFRYFAEVPAVHLSIQAFLVLGKNLLDLLSQLLSSQRIVHTLLHGFHKKGSVVGGVVLHALTRKRNPRQTSVAEAISEHINRHKATWIDRAVGARDLLTHPVRGTTTQLMCELQIRVDEDQIVCDHVVSPHVGDQPFDR